jgi:methionyl-tRNA formyltransferase
MVDALTALEAGTLKAEPQPSEGATYAKKIDKRETRIDFSQSAQTVVDHIRGLSPYPGAWFEANLGGKPERIKVLRASVSPLQGAPGTLLDDALTIACGEGAIRIDQLQRAGKQPMAASDFLRGVRLTPGNSLVGG